MHCCSSQRVAFFRVITKPQAVRTGASLLAIKPVCNADPHGDPDRSAQGHKDFVGALLYRKGRSQIGWQQHLRDRTLLEFAGR